MPSRRIATSSAPGALRNRVCERCRTRRCRREVRGSHSHRLARPLDGGRRVAAIATAISRSVRCPRSVVVFASARSPLAGCVGCRYQGPSQSAFGDSAGARASAFFSGRARMSIASAFRSSSRGCRRGPGRDAAGSADLNASRTIASAGRAGPAPDPGGERRHAVVTKPGDASRSALPRQRSCARG